MKTLTLEAERWQDATSPLLMELASPSLLTASGKLVRRGVLCSKLDRCIVVIDTAFKLSTVFKIHFFVKIFTILLSCVIKTRKIKYFLVMFGVRIVNGELSSCLNQN